MRELSDKNFGLAIAYLIPGFVVLLGVASISATVGEWLGPGGAAGEPTIGRFLYVLFGSLTAGLIVSAIRWAIVDTLHHRTGVMVPSLDFSKLSQKIDSFVLIVEANYRFYQFYANLFVALPFALFCRGLSSDTVTGPIWLSAIVIEIILFAGSRDSLQRYYERASALLGEKHRPCSGGTWDEDV